MGAPDAVVENALSTWGSPYAAFDDEIRAAYRDALTDPAHIHGICEEYRAAATRDREDDDADRRASRRISCPVLVLWSAQGRLDAWYSGVGGPLAIWRRWADKVAGGPLDASHFCPEEIPEQTAAALAAFFEAQH